MEILMKYDQTWWEYSSQEYKKRNDEKKSLDESVKGVCTPCSFPYTTQYSISFSVSLVILGSKMGQPHIKNTKLNLVALESWIHIQ